MPKPLRIRRFIQLVLSLAIIASMSGSVFALTHADEFGVAVDRPAAHPAAAPGSHVAAAGGGTVEAVAIDVASKGSELPIADGDMNDPARYCDTTKMKVLWTKPGAAYRHGAFIEPLGPAPGPDTTKVNGIVVCEGSDYAYMGFEARRMFSGWEVIPVPVIDGDEGPNHREDPAGEDDPGLVPHATLPSKPKASKPSGGVVKPAAKLTAAIETYAGYEAQSTCSPSVKPGVAAFRKQVLAANPMTRSLGITRNCSVGGRSEHKEGRAWDWGANVNRPAERKAAQKLIAWLFATDEYGNTHAMARRLGVMYIVYDRKIWGAYRADEGWRPYNGASPHTDHVHFSFAWPGAQGKTSFWTGKPALMPGGGGGRGGGSLIGRREKDDNRDQRDWRDRIGDKTGHPVPRDKDRKPGDRPDPSWKDWRDRPDGVQPPGGGNPGSGWNGGGGSGWNGGPGSGSGGSQNPGSGGESRLRDGDGSSERPSYRKRRGKKKRRGNQSRNRRRRGGRRTEPAVSGPSK